MITNDNNLRERVLKDIMDELGIENPNKKKKKDKEDCQKCLIPTMVSCMP